MHTTIYLTALHIINNLYTLQYKQAVFTAPRRSSETHIRQVYFNIIDSISPHNKNFKKTLFLCYFEGKLSANKAHLSSSSLYNFSKDSTDAIVAPKLNISISSTVQKYRSFEVNNTKELIELKDKITSGEQIHDDREFAKQVVKLFNKAKEIKKYDEPVRSSFYSESMTEFKFSNLDEMEYKGKEEEKKTMYADVNGRICNFNDVIEGKGFRNERKTNIELEAVGKSKLNEGNNEKFEVYEMPVIWDIKDEKLMKEFDKVLESDEVLNNW